MGSLSINLTDRLERLVRQKVESGLYNSASEVIREALRQMERSEQSRTDRLEPLFTSAVDVARPGALRSAIEVHALQGKADIGIEAIPTNA
jgi:putative addiction module CopG family antidote